MSAQAAITRSWKVGRYTATLNVPRATPGAVACAVIEWEPGLPDLLTAAEVTRYVRGRNAALAEMAAEMGITAAVVDL